MVGGNIDRKATCVPNRPWCHVLLARLPPNNGFPPSACCPVCTTLMLLNRQVVYRAEWILSGTNAEEIWRFSQFRNNRCRLKNIQLSIAPYLNFTWPILSNQKPNKNRKTFPCFSSLYILYFLQFAPNIQWIEVALLQCRLWDTSSPICLWSDQTAVALPPNFTLCAPMHQSLRHFSSPTLLSSFAVILSPFWWCKRYA